MMDVNGLKQINDTYGHNMGDLALRDTVNVIRSCIRHNDFVARVGGDEFIVILDVKDVVQLALARERIEQCVTWNNCHSLRLFA